MISNLNKKAHKVYGADSPPLRPSTPDQVAQSRTPTRSGGSSTESSSSQGLVRQTTVPVTSLQKSFTKLYSLTATSSAGSGTTVPFDKSPARTMTVKPIIEKDGEARLTLMESTCPVCRRSGLISPLYTFSLASETFSNLCSNISCAYPFESYDGLLSSLPQSQLNLTLPSSDVDYIPDSSLELNLDFLEPPESEDSSSIARNSETLQQSTPLNNVNIGPPVLQKQVQKPRAILPRYLADSMREANSTPRGFSHSPDSDSGVSTNSTKYNLSYQEILALRAQRPKIVKETSKPFSQWTPEERFAFLKKLIILSSSDERLEFFNFYKTVVPETSIDFTRLLPRSISLYILSFLDPRSLCRACQVSEKPIKTKTAPRCVETSKSPDRKRLDSAENTHQRMNSGRCVERNSEKQMSMKERIAGVTERLSAPLERRRRNSISYSPIQNITRNEKILKQRQSSLPRRRVNLPTSMIVAPPGQRFAPLSPESIKTLPPPPVYKPKTEVGKIRERNWTKRQQQIFDYVKDIPS
ncbi:unnamed protein product [Hymenolepis diminuta]|uniref:F-box domain-containing protein n=1 Tax=Hymenolepis diminuta TaxID=6216 RepID=A0A3P6W373_HYMDI|nr:unnamed protein product [Hymenolepis diminuta]